MAKMDNFMDKVTAEIRRDAAQYKTKVEFNVEDVVNKEDLNKMLTDLKKRRR